MRHGLGLGQQFGEWRRSISGGVFDLGTTGGFSMYTLTTPELIAILTTLAAGGGDFNGAKLSLFSDNLTPGKNTLLADLNAITSNGIANAATVTWGTVYTNDNGAAEVLGNTETFLTTSAPGSPITAFGYFLTDSGGTVLLLAERFATPVVFSRTNQAFALTPRLTMDSGS
jgi:hypothetical protein